MAYIDVKLVDSKHIQSKLFGINTHEVCASVKYGGTGAQIIGMLSKAVILLSEKSGNDIDDILSDVLQTANNVRRNDK